MEVPWPYEQRWTELWAEGQEAATLLGHHTSWDERVPTAARWQQDFEAQYFSVHRVSASAKIGQGVVHTVMATPLHGVVGGIRQSEVVLIFSFNKCSVDQCPLSHDCIHYTL